jgi:hypothetical protein
MAPAAFIELYRSGLSSYTGQATKVLSRADATC